MSSFSTGTVIVGPLTVLGNTNVNWNHNVGATAVKVEMLDAERLTNTSSKIFIEQTDNNNLKVINLSASTFVVTLWVTFETPSQTSAGTVPASDASLTVVP